MSTAATEQAASGGDVVLEMRGVTVQRHEATLLRDVDWAVRTGEHWVVVGSNGAGKTTLLQVAAGAVPATRGEVELLGEPLDEADLDDLLPRVGFASAAVADRFSPYERVLDVVLTSAYAAVARRGEHYDADDEARALALLAQVGCRGLAPRRYATLSEGERKRVHVARALMPDPELLLLDEPAAGLDLGGREALLRRLSRLAADDGAPAMVLVSHHVEEVPVGFTHALLLRAGEVVAAGPVDETLTSAALTEAFGLPLLLERHGGRFSARAGFSRA